VQELRATLPLLPEQIAAQLAQESGLLIRDATLIASDPAALAFFREVRQQTNKQTKKQTKKRTLH
jgi:Asp-tRNA(Asn)/Glu-tRNA(Gln) amidotransferase B subunit